MVEVDSVEGRLGDQTGFQTQQWCDRTFEKVWAYCTFILNKYFKVLYQNILLKCHQMFLQALPQIQANPQ